MYSVKGVKNFIGEDGRGFNASLYRDGKKIALVSDMADGGPIRFDWDDYKSDEPAKFSAYVASLPDSTKDAKLASLDEDVYACKLVGIFDMQKKLRAGLAKSIYYVKDEELYSSKAKYTPQLGERLKVSNPELIVLNALTFDDAWKVFEKYGIAE